jgi:hypothetical protein
MSPTGYDIVQISPSEEQIISLAGEIRSKAPGLAVAKVLWEIKKRQPKWTLSEKIPLPLH